MSANVEVRKATVDLTPVGAGRLTLRSDGKLVNAELRFAHQKGHLDATARAALEWQGLLPTLDESRPVHIDAQARRFDAVVISPFLRDVFSELSGPVTANVNVVLRKNPKAKDDENEPAWTSQIYGNGAMTDGTMQLQALGLELRDVSFGAVARDFGKGTVIEINSLMAKARSNRPNLRGRGSIYIEGLRVLRGSASFSAVDVPLLIEGVSQATATGVATATLERQDDEMEVDVQIPQLEAKLPRSSGRNVINVDENKAVTISQPLGEPEEVSGPAMPWRFVINLGKNVRIRRNDMYVPITGQPVIEIGEQTEVRGFVELEPGGRIQALGKVFVIESGRVRFDTDDPSDPHLYATASWRAPDGSTVYIDVQGTLKEARVNFSSDPARPEAEIMALLLGGPAPATGQDEEGAGGGAAAAGSAAVGGAAPIVNELLADSPLGSVELRTATYEGQSSYTAAVQITEEVWFETTYRSREAQENTPGADTVDVSGTVDWRFRRNWSLRTEVGTIGGGLDLLWQYRY
jgi:autotransporter translocation and assembly factor TamB